MLAEPAGASVFLGPLAQELLSAVCPDAVRYEIATLLADSCSIGLLDRERPAGWEDFVDRWFIHHLLRQMPHPHRLVAPLSVTL